MLNYRKVDKVSSYNIKKERNTWIQNYSEMQVSLFFIIIIIIEIPVYNTEFRITL